ncbi:MAG: hypothetical protein EBR79_01410, partial [Proteobacteria bacterium]|nr:hypothetical protein [Pseudomonadota bacterium]
LMLFPDPWPKSKHHKRRLLQPELLQLIAQALRPQGEFWLVTDWPDYAFHTIALLQSAPQFTFPQTALAAAACKVKANAASPINHQQTLGPHHLATPPTWWIPTKYQQKAAKVGRLPWFINALKVAPKNS